MSLIFQDSIMLVAKSTFYNLKVKMRFRKEFSFLKNKIDNLFDY
ncbi:hypothetical protein RCH18_002557 [Flavobacterium sp. PL11]|nr:hypothetical protein [Flavobacterium sp. PL11]